MEIKSRQTYNGQNFSGRDFARTKVSESEFEGCTFDKCAFNEAVLSHCRFIKCRFVGCDLSLARPENCKFTEVSFVECKLVGVDWALIGEAKADRMLFAVSFDRCVLDYAVFKGLPVKSIVKCTARETDFSEADMQDADCGETDFAAATFMRTDMRGADFSGARNYTIEPTQNKVRKAQFSWPEAGGLLVGFGVVLEE
jgi:fluoroquinolone resistance protein